MLTEVIQKIDDKEYNIKWNIPYSSITAHSCGIFKAGLAITVERGVALCPEMPPVEYLRNKRLSEIIKEYPFNISRNIEQYIEEPCKYINTCFGGCRSKALTYTGRITGCDLFCNLIDNDSKKIKKDFSNCEIELEINEMTTKVANEKLENFIKNEDNSKTTIIYINNNDITKKNIVEKILKIHIRENDELIKIKNSGIYLFICKDSNEDISNTLFKRLNDLLKKESEDIIKNAKFIVGELHYSKDDQKNERVDKFFNIIKENFKIEKSRPIVYFIGDDIELCECYKAIKNKEEKND